MTRSTAITLVAFVTCAVLAAAQGPPPAPTPAPELKKLDYFVGTWKSTGDLKPGLFGRGGKISGSEHNEWMAGHFFLVLHSTETGPMGHAVGTAFMGYSTEDKNYTFDSFNSMGEAEHAKGTVEGDTWTWTATEKMNGQTMKGRYTVTVASPTSYNFKFEIAPESGGDYTTVVEGKATKVASAGAAKGAGDAATKK